MSTNDALGNGWFVAVADRQHGPLTASEALQLLADINIPEFVQIWHPSLDGWRTIAASAHGPVSRPLPATINLRELRLCNAQYLTWIACCALPISVLSIALAREFQDGVMLSVIAALVCFMAWWFYLEYVGVRLLNTEILFPQRVAIWPFPALWPRRVRIADMSGFECWSNGSQVHWFKLNTLDRPVKILLDDALHREILILSLEQRLAPASPPDAE